MNVAFLKVEITKEDLKKITDSLKSGFWVLGKEAKEFEKKLAQYLGVKEVVLTNSCTSSIHLSLLIAGVKPGDEVITVPLSYVSTVNPILYCGAKPVFVDVDPETGLMDVNQVEKAITTKTKAIIPVHLYGQMADIKRLSSLAKKHDIAVVEDAAHAIEAVRDGIRPGQKSFSACFSFHVAKNISAGEGGAIATNDPAVARFARLLRRDGVENVGPKRIMQNLGYKYLMTDFQASLLNSQLNRIQARSLVRERLFNNYVKGFTGSNVKFPVTLPNVNHAHHMFVVWVDPKKRDKMREMLLRAGIQTSIHYDPIHLEPFYKKEFGFKKNDFPHTEKLGFSTITLPLHLKLTQKEQDYVIDKVKEISKKV